MARILVVEDELVQRQMLCERLTDDFPGVHVDESGTVSDAEAMIESAARRGVRYVAVVLDINIPRAPGEKEEYQFGLREKILHQRNSSGAFIFYVSAYLSDPKIQDFRRAVLKEFEEDKNMTLPRPVFLDKSDFLEKSGQKGWIGEVSERLRWVIHPRRIRARLDEVLPMLFGQGQQPRLAPAGAAPRWPPDGEFFAPADPTQSLANLEGDIEQNWPYLDEQTRKEVKTHFVVRESPSGAVKVSLI